MSRSRARIYRDIESLRARFDESKGPIRERLRDFSSVPRADYYYELVYCLLTPQSSAVNVAKAVDALKAAEQNTVDILADRRHYIRFHNTKAKRIAEAQRDFPAILQKLSNGAGGTELREWLVRNVKGLGWKEASHFLRNIGYRDLAILDRHILKNLKRHGVLRSLPKTLTVRRYHQIERRFAQFSAEIGISMDELDLLFWSSETGAILK